MSPNAPQGIVRSLIVDADRLSRLSYADHQEVLAQRFAALRTELLRVERRIGAWPSHPPTRGEIDVVYQKVCDVASAAIGREPRGLLDRMVMVASRLRAPRPFTLLGMPAVRRDS